MKKTKPLIPDLAALRNLCGKFAPWEHPDAEGRQIRPGLWRKTYNAHLPKGRWLYMPAVLEPSDTRRPLPEIAAMLDKRSLDELCKQATDALGQMRFRAPPLPRGWVAI